jgi:hypothetical protein
MNLYGVDFEFQVYFVITLILLFMKSKISQNHSMVIANLKTSEEFVTNTTAASKYIPRRPRISIN